MNSQSVLINSDSLKYIQDRIAEQQASIDSLTNVVNEYGVFDTMGGIITFGGLVIVLSIWRYLNQFNSHHLNRFNNNRGY